MQALRGLLDAFGAGAMVVALLACAVLGVTVAIGEHGWPGASSSHAFDRLGEVPAGTPGLTVATRLEVPAASVVRSVKASPRSPAAQPARSPLSVTGRSSNSRTRAKNSAASAP